MNSTKGSNGSLLVLAGALVAAATLAFLGPVQTSAQHQGEGHGQPAKRTAHWAPVEQMHLYLCAFHVAKERPDFQVEAHHFCSPQGKELHQCVIYDGKKPGAKLLGVEYIIPDEAYQRLSADEKKYWHPHAYEILSGQLIAPDMPNEGDAAFPGFLKTWGKTWHTWPDPSKDMPLGTPLLMWSANGDDQISQSLITQRDAQFGISTAQIRERRKAMGFKVPNIPPAKSINDLGRQFTTTGPDEPVPLAKP